MIFIFIIIPKQSVFVSAALRETVGHEENPKLSDNTQYQYIPTDETSVNV